jgi:hypothetical protein
MIRSSFVPCSARVEVCSARVAVWLCGCVAVERRRAFVLGGGELVEPVALAFHDRGEPAELGGVFVLGGSELVEPVAPALHDGSEPVELDAERVEAAAVLALRAGDRSELLVYRLDIVVADLPVVRRGRHDGEM